MINKTKKENYPFRMGDIGGPCAMNNVHYTLFDTCTYCIFYSVYIVIIACLSLCTEVDSTLISLYYCVNYDCAMTMKITSILIYLFS